MALVSRMSGLSSRTPPPRPLHNIIIENDQLWASYHIADVAQALRLGAQLIEYRVNGATKMPADIAIQFRRESDVFGSIPFPSFFARCRRNSITRPELSKETSTPSPGSVV